MPTGYYFSDEQRTEICIAYQSGKTRLSLAEQYGVTGHTITRVLKLSGIKMSYPTLLTKEQATQAVTMYESGKTCKEIGAVFGITGQSIRGYLRRANVPMRNTESKRVNKKAIIEDYKAGNTQTKLIKKYGVCRNTIRDFLKESNTRRRDPNEYTRKYKINENYFDQIDTEIKAYFLGLLYADGHNRVENFSISIELQERDVEILKPLKEDIGYEGPMYYVLGRDGRQNKYVFKFACKKLSMRLIELGVKQNKTFSLSFPDFIPNHLLHHFIRGYFDGDGCIFVDKTNKKNCAISVVGTVDFSLGFKKAVEKACEINLRIINHPTSHDKGIRLICSGGRSQLLKFADFMYKEANVFLVRKKDKFDYLRRLRKGRNNKLIDPTVTNPLPLESTLYLHE